MRPALRMMLMAAAAQGGGGPSAYYQKVLTIQPDYLEAFWPLNDKTGLVATDVSGNNRHGVIPAALALSNAAGPDGVAVPYFNGENGQGIALGGAGCIRDVTAIKTVGTVSIWGKVNALSTWIDNSNDLLVTLKYNSSDDIHIKKDAQTTSNAARIAYRRDTTTDDSDSNKAFMGTVSAWYHTALTWDEATGHVISYYNGAQVEDVAAGAWAGVDWRDSWIGSFSNNASCFKGWLALCGLWSTALTPTEIAALATV